MSFLGTTTTGEQYREQVYTNGKARARRLRGYDDDEDEEEETALAESGFWNRPLLNEWNFTFILFLFSLSIVIGKLFLSHDFFSFLDVNTDKFNTSIPYYKEIADKAVIEPLYKYSWFVKAVFTGLATTGMTWFILYEDSNVPGINPPSPFSPSKKRIYQESPSLELNYLVGGLIGFLVFLYMCL